MAHWQTGRYLLLIGITIIFLVHGAGGIVVPFLERMESVIYDVKVRNTAPGTKDSRIVIVDIDEKSLAGLGSWPWPRDRMATLVDTLFDHYRIGVLGFDLVFSEADTSSGLSLLESLAKGPLSQNSIFLNQFHKLKPTLDRDRIFAQSLRDRPVILGFNFLQTSFSGLADSGKLPSPVVTLHELGHDDLNSVKAFGYAANIGELQDAAAGAGFLDHPLTGPDGVARNTPLLQVFNGALYQSLSLGIIRAILGDPPLTLEFQENSRHQGAKNAGFEWIALGRHRIAVDAKGGILIPYRGGKGSFPYVSAIDILERVPERQLLDAAIVLVGSSIGTGLRPPFVTPFAHAIPGVELHANIISGMLDGTFKSRPHLFPWSDMVLLAVIGLVVSLFFPRIPLSWRFLVVLVISVVLIVGNVYVWSRWDLHVPLAAPMILMLFLFAIDVAFEIFAVSLKRHRLETSFGKHLPATVIDELARSGYPTSIKGEQREVTVVMAVVQDFYRKADTLSPMQMEQWTHGFLTPMTEIIHEYRGTLDHYHGASIIAFWGAPLDDPKHGRNALAAVMAMSTRLEKLEDEFQMRGLPVVHCHFAIQSGLVTTGSIGSRFRNDYTAFGQPFLMVQSLVRLVEGYDTPILVAEETKSLVSEMVFRELDRIVPEDADKPVSIHEPIGFRDQVAPDRMATIEACHKAMAQFRMMEWDLAEQGFRKLLRQDPEDRICELYLARIRKFRKTPPPVDWDGTCRPPR
ncbi:MAG: adenylate/guanylate cyclase domain-containing protein [Magnetococcales bacterium]|nr:adenylate/guanylate cyclase domain-containing protein [Magnetococcales bacterium]